MDHRASQWTADQPIRPRSPAQPLRILIVEDNRDAADSLRLFLELLGHQVMVAYTGPEGLAVALAECPQVVLCDLGLPGLDGFGIARALRGSESMGSARLIAISGYASEEDRIRSREAGFDSHLVKPADPEVLLSLLG